MSIFKDKVLLITGGTGSFGNAVLRRFLDSDIKEIRIFSRDEKKQDDMRHEYQVKMPEVADKHGIRKNRFPEPSWLPGKAVFWHLPFL